MLSHRVPAARSADAAVQAAGLPALVGRGLESLLQALSHAGNFALHAH